MSASRSTRPRSRSAPASASPESSTRAYRDGPESTEPESGKVLKASASRRGIYDQYIPLVRRIGMRVVRRLPPNVTADDILGAGWIGLIEATQRRTDTMSENEFEAYASHRIRGAILDYLRTLDPMSRKLRGASKRIAAAIRLLSTRLGRAPEEDEIASELGLEIGRYRDLLGDVSTAQFARIELTDFFTPRSLPDAGPDFIAQRRELTDCVALAIERLPDRLRIVLGLYYQDECNFREIGDIVGVTESRVCQLHSEAIHRVRASVDAFEERPSRPTPVVPISKFRR